jgi:FkbH-like protein
MGKLEGYGMSSKTIKCVVWDLDQTLWDGILTEDGALSLRPKVREIVEELDRRGILQSICSKNDYEPAMKQLKEFQLEKYFVYPQINWGPKSENIKKIREALNFGIDTFAFIDDQIFEREEVAYAIPEVLCIDANSLDRLLDRKEMLPQYVTEDSRNRRLLYLNDMERNQIEESFQGTPEEFLKTLDLKFTVAPADEKDLLRVEELTVRTHQLNSTGTQYSYEDLLKLIHSEDHIVLIAQMDDKYGQYGKIGISVIEKHEDYWDIKLLLMSCRVISKGVGAVMLKYIMKLALKHGVRLYADFVPTDRNRIMYITYKFGGFKEIKNEGGYIRLEADLLQKGEYPDYLTLIDEFKNE